MKYQFLYLSIICSILTLSLNAQNNCTEDHHGALEVGYPISTDLPENTVLGVNGRVFIYNGTEPINTVTFREDIVKEFALIVAGSQTQTTDGQGNTVTQENGGGIVAIDLGIGASNLYMNLPDYVFDEDYTMNSLGDIQAYVQKHKHLPDVIGQKELDEQGYFLVDRMLFAQLKNLEELVLHTIQQEKKIKAQEEENKRLRKWAEELGKRLEALEESKE
ncbi:hypothetical protein KORDIASMS9_02929 [Kordia sp. SMS9]|uniref:hypothetical protein n=1 Tax=Kordia sp. SMS9 TaxID=2282170 RepID=UPI000E0D3138|nr:hypothetical protein [Kordia sp. SMS9]AXG70683.1 hypothetical protein KORDIASMS9_02929 [Kordia sp. SMS9]